jgi:3-oxoacyl-[acyl-carrier protein] reductase
MADTLDFSGKVVLVTGSSRGIGAAILRAFARNGATCIVNYVADPDGRNKADADQVAGEINAALSVECNVADAQQVAAMMDQVKQRFGGLDVLVNNAGILRDRTLKKMTSEEWNSVLAVNLGGCFNTIRSALPILRGGGRVVNISSVAAFGGFFGQANYAASKAGIVALTKVAARELAKQNVTVNAIAPGFIDTDMTKGMPDDVTRKFMEQIPLGRIGTPEEIANVALLLCSPLSNYLTGQVLHVNGGFYMP